MPESIRKTFAVLNSESLFETVESLLDVKLVGAKKIVMPQVTERGLTIEIKAVLVNLRPVLSASCLED